MNSERRDPFWKKFPGLVWSNSEASDSVMIRAALTRFRFHELLAICLEFGLDRVVHEFEVIREELGAPERISTISGMLTNIRRGFERAEETSGKRLEEAAHAA
jgi:hypothetical protein